MGEILSSHLYSHSKETGVSVVTQADQDILNSKSIFILKLQSTMHAIAAMVCRHVKKPHSAVDLNIIIISLLLNLF